MATVREVSIAFTQSTQAGGGTTLISNGGDPNSSSGGGSGFFVPTAIYPVPGDKNEVYIVDEQQRVVYGLTNAHGTVWEVNLTTGTQNAVTRGGPYLDASGGSHFGNPVDVAVNSSGVMVIMQDGPITVSPYSGDIVTWTSSQGQVILTPDWTGGAANGMTLSSGTNFVDDAAIGADTPNVYKVDPSTGDASELASGGHDLYEANGITIWYSTGTGDSPSKASGGSAASSVLLSSPTDPSASTVGAANTATTVQSVTAPSGNTVVMSPIATSSGSGGTSAATAGTAFVAIPAATENGDRAFGAYAAVGPAMSPAEWQSLLESLIPA
jgi:hypothetical protein